MSPIREGERTQPAAEPNTPDSAIEGYLIAANNVRELLEFYQADKGDWTAVDAKDPARGRRLRDTYERLVKAQKFDPAYKDQNMSLYDVAVAVMNRFQARAADLQAAQPKPPQRFATTRIEKPLRVERPRKLLDRVQLVLPHEVAQTWQILKVNETKRTYIVGRDNDRRPVTDVIADVVAQRTFRGMASGYELSWEQLEQYAGANGASGQQAAAA